MAATITFQRGQATAREVNDDLAVFREQMTVRGSEAYEFAERAGLGGEAGQAAAADITATQSAGFGGVETILIQVGTAVAKEVFDHVFLPWYRRRRGNTHLGERRDDA